jgi:drug/metabolite transporter (DMT)-like permease
MKKRPFGVTVLAILSGFLAALAIFAALRFLGVMFRPVGLVVPGFWYALMYGLLAWVYIWLTQMLWRLDPAAWLFLAVITVFNLVLNFIVLVTGNAFTDVSVAIFVNALILLYVMLPGTKKAFGMDKPPAPPAA